MLVVQSLRICLVPLRFADHHAFLGHQRCYNPTDEQYLPPYNVIYNGTLSFAMQNLASSGCTANESVHQVSLSIGDMFTFDGKYNRTGWDSNPFYFNLNGCDTHWPYSVNSTMTNPGPWTCKYVPSTANFESSRSSSGRTDGDGRFWSLSATKSGDGFDVSGNLMPGIKTGLMSMSLALDCPSLTPSLRTFQSHYVQDIDGISMKGHISPSHADLTFTVSNWTITYASCGCYGVTNVAGTTRFADRPFSYTFSGGWWNSSAALLTNGTAPRAQGVVKGYKDSQDQQEEAMSTIKRIWKYIVAGVAGGIGLLVLLCCACCCFRRKRNAQPQQLQANLPPQQQPQQDPAYGVIIIETPQKYEQANPPYQAPPYQAPYQAPSPYNR